MAITDLLDKSKYVSQEEYDRRINLCNSCPDRAENNNGVSKPVTKFSTCPHCSCLCWLKTKLSTEECPMGDW